MCTIDFMTIFVSKIYQFLPSSLFFYPRKTIGIFVKRNSINCYYRSNMASTPLKDEKKREQPGENVFFFNFERRNIYLKNKNKILKNSN